MKKIILLLIYLFLLKYLIHILLPIIISSIILICIKPLYTNKTKIIQLLIVLISYIFLILFFSFFIIFIIYYLYINQYEIIKWYNFFIKEIMTFININIFISYISYFFNHIFDLFILLFFIVLSSFYIVFEYDDIHHILKKYFNQKQYLYLLSLKQIIINNIRTYMYIQCLNIIITLIILFITFTLLKIKQAFLISLFISFIEIFPIIGIGILMIPMIIYYLVHGYYMNALYIFLVYVFISMIKEIIETYMYNKSLKIPNIFLFISSIIHLYLYGFIGLFLSMIHMNILFAYIDSKKN